jgi:dimethylargininase
MLMAITRAVSESLGRCELTHLAREPIDIDRARAQHAAYEAALRSMGVGILQVQPAPDSPDAVFVEDTAVVIDEAAVMTRPGARSRWHETAGVAEVLARYRELKSIGGEGRLDGGDVLRLGRAFFVGRSSRTNEEGIRQLREFLGRWGYTVESMEITGCLHLKSAVTQVAEAILLVNPAWLPQGAFAGMERIEVDPAERYGANALWVRDRVIYPAHFPRTRERLERRGIGVVEAPCDELAKAEGALTCCSILFEDAPR